MSLGPPPRRHIWKGESLLSLPFSAGLLRRPSGVVLLLVAAPGLPSPSGLKPRPWRLGCLRLVCGLGAASSALQRMDVMPVGMRFVFPSVSDSESEDDQSLLRKRPWCLEGVLGAVMVGGVVRS